MAGFATIPGGETRPAAFLPLNANMPRILDRRLPEEAFHWIDALPRSWDVETVSLAEAAGRILGRDVDAARDVPAQRTAAVNGFALRASDTVGAGDYNPLPLELHPMAQGLVRGEAAAVLSGDPIPVAGDAVLPLEYAEVRGGYLEAAQALAAGEGVVEPGEECRAGDLLLPAGRCLRPQDLAHLALAGWDGVPVWRRPAVRLLMAGRYGTDADGPMLKSLVARDGGFLESACATPDQASLVAALDRPGADLILVAGAAGEGEGDHALPSLERAGAVDIHRVAIHPGGNVALGRAGGAPVVLLPGAPLACFCAYDLLAARILRRLARLPGPWPYRSCVLPLAGKLTSGIGRLDLCRVRVRNGLAEPLAVAEARILATAVRADGFVVVPAESEGYGRGTEVLVHLYD